MDASPALAQARNLIALRRYDNALETLTPALGDPSTEAEAWCLQTFALLAKGDLTNALPAARKAIALDPEDEWPHRLLALVYQKGKNHKAALHSAQEAARIAPHQIESLHMLAICLANTRKKAEAEKVANSLLDLHPHSALAHRTAGTVASVRKDWTTAEMHLREALRIEPNDADVSIALAAVLKRLGRREEAGQALLAAARSDPTHQSIRKSLGRLGLPAVALGGFALKGLIALQLARNAHHVRPATAAIVMTAIVLIVGGGLTYARIKGTRDLPESVRQGLMSDHRNYALGWLGSAALASVPLAIWAALAPADQGRSTELSIALVIFSVLALSLILKLWTGPFPNRVPNPLPALTSWVVRHWPSRTRRSVR